MSKQVNIQTYLKTEDSQMKYTSILPPSSSQLSKTIKCLQKMYQQQKEKRQQSQRKVQIVQLRSLQRQSQFVKIVKKLKEDNRVIGRQAPEIQKLFNKIWDCFDEFNKNTVQIIQKKYEDNYKSMDRRLSVILQHFRIQLIKKQKNNIYNIDEIQKQMRLLCQTAIKIQDKNIQLLEKVKNLQFQRKVLIQEKFLILQDLNRKKSKVNTLSQQIKMLKRLRQINQRCNKQKIQDIKNQLNQTKGLIKLGNSRGMDQRHIRIIKKSQSKTVDFQEVKELIKIRSEAQPPALSTLNLPCKQTNNDTNNDSIKNDKQMNKIGSTITYTPRSCHNQSYTSQTNRKQKNSSLFITNNKKNRNNLEHYKISLRVSSVHNQDDDNSQINPCMNDKNPSNTNLLLKKVECPWCRNKVTIPQNNSQEDKVKEQHYLNTIQNLQRCIKRQKQKIINLGNIVTRFLNKSQQVNQVLQKIILQIREQPFGKSSTDSCQKLDSIIHTEKFYNMIKVLQQRLSMLQRPQVSCGWGETWAQIMPDL